MSIKILRGRVFFFVFVLFSVPVSARGTALSGVSRGGPGSLVAVVSSTAGGYGDGGEEDGGSPNPYSYASYQRGAQAQDNSPRQQYQQQFQQQQQYPRTAGVAAGQQAQVNPLLKQVSTASIGLLFALLIWRSLSAYELADQFSSGSLRLLAVTPTVFILCANLAGFVVNMFRPVGFKNHLKLILVMNICREIAELVYNMLMVLFTSSQSAIPREVYFGRFMMSSWWLFLTLGFAKSRWVSTVSLPRAFVPGNGGAGAGAGAGGGGGGYGYRAGA